MRLWEPTTAIIHTYMRVPYRWASKRRESARIVEFRRLDAMRPAARHSRDALRSDDLRARAQSRRGWAARRHARGAAAATPARTR